MPQTYQVTCSECGEVRWPYLSERPGRYVCVRCKSGVGSAKREAGRKVVKARKWRRSQLQAATEALPADIGSCIASLKRIAAKIIS